MKEELYIYTDKGVRKSVDLNTPSGITLKWVSNLFNSLDKVNCSYSYTFTIPLTRHNREVFEYAEDIRHISGLLGKKVKCEYIQNGLPLFYNSYLYIDKTTSKGYSCAMTWNVNDGLQKLKNEGCSLNELRDALVKAGYDSDELEDNGMVSGSLVPDKDIVEADSPSAFNNGLKVMTPYYSAGVPFCRREFEDSTKETYMRYNFYMKCYPRPVMPTKYLLDTIEKAFDVVFDICRSKSGEDDLKVLDDKSKVFDGSNVVDYGCLPLVNTDMTDKQIRNLFKIQFMGMSSTTAGGTKYEIFFPFKVLGQDNVFKFTRDLNSTNGDWVAKGDKNYLKYAYIRSDKSTEFDAAYVSSVPKTGYTLAGFSSCFGCEVQIRLKARQSDVRYDWNNDDSKTQIIVWSYKAKDKRHSSYEYEEVTTLKPVSVRTHYKNGGEFDYDELVFDTYKDDGYEPLNVGDEQTDEQYADSQKYYFFKFSNKYAQVVDFGNMVVTPKVNDAKYISHYMDTFTNLPDIDCLTFVKSIMCMMGKYPVVNNNGIIKAESYDTLRINKEKGFAYDWSHAVMSHTDMPEETTFNVSDFKQNNYYLTKWDDLERTEDELQEEEDVYADGTLDVKVPDLSLDKEQTVFQIPFYPPYILNRKNPITPTGNTIKAWGTDLSSLDEPLALINDDGDFLVDDTTKFVSKVESKPAYGIIHCRPFYNSDGSVQKDSDGKIIRMMRMDILNPFVDSPSNNGYSYLQKMLKNPFVITEKLMLNEFDLIDIDFSRPVYLDKYSSYFAIISIQRNSDGICKCELIKLPTE